MSNKDKIAELNQLMRILEIDEYDTDGKPDVLYLYEVNFYDSEYKEPLFCEPYMTVVSTADIPKGEFELILEKMSQAASTFEEFKSIMEQKCGFVIGEVQSKNKAYVNFEIEIPFEKMEDKT